LAALCEKRHITCGRACSEVGDVNEENVDYLISKSLPPMNNAFHIDETALLFTDGRKDLDTERGNG